MNVYSAQYFRQFGYGAFQEYSYLLIANTKSEALGLALEAELDSIAKCWSIEKVDHNKPSANFMADNHR